MLAGRSWTDARLAKLALVLALVLPSAAAYAFPSTATGFLCSRRNACCYGASSSLRQASLGNLPGERAGLRMQGQSTAEEVPSSAPADKVQKFDTKLSSIIGIANMTSELGWKLSVADTVGARDRDGTWVTRNADQMELVFNALNSTVPRAAAFEWLLQSPMPVYMILNQTVGVEVKLLVVPPGQILPPVEHPTGTVVLSKALYGACDVRQMLGDPRGSKPMREAVRQRISTEGVTLYLGGPCRVYGEATLEAPCAILEVALIPSLKITSMKGFVESNENAEHASLPALVSLNAQAQQDLLTGPGFPGYAEEAESARKTSLWEEVTDDDQRLDIDVDSLRTNVGGLDEQLAAIVRRAFATRRLPPQVMSSLGLSHVKGMLLYGPPGCGKTLIAREIARVLRSRPPKIVSGPEILDKWVGEAERNIRALFYEAEREWDERGPRSGLHVIIFDEMDALARTRGSLSGDSSGVRDSVVNQLLAKLDGVRQMDNVLVIGLTNRRDLIDPALLRPGRMEVHLEIQAPDEAGRNEILGIHLRKLRSAGRLEDDAWDSVAELARDKTSGWSGAELAGLVRSATSFALQRALDVMQDPKAASESSANSGEYLPSSSGIESKAAALDVRVSAEDLLRAQREIEDARPKRRFSLRQSLARLLRRR